MSIFLSNDISNYFKLRINSIKKEVQEVLEGKDVIDTKCINSLFEKNKIIPLVLKSDDKKIISRKDISIDVTPIQKTLTSYSNSVEKVYIDGVEIKIGIPYKGEKALFTQRPSKLKSDLAKVNEITEEEIILIYEMDINKIEENKSIIDGDIAVINEYISFIKEDVDAFNAGLRAQIESIVKARMARIKAKEVLIESLGIPMKKYEDYTKKLTVPLEKKAVTVSPVKTGKKDVDNAKIIAEKDYEDILEILHNMSIAMERSPKVFSKLYEEDIRDFFLVLLNGHYKGMATGETFNASGDTDILIRVDNNNLFIGECKFWKGEVAFNESIKQLFGYVTWRDTKTAIVIFNKNRKTTDVINKIRNCCEKHEQYKAKYELLSTKVQHDTILSYIYKHPKDDEKETILSILIFDIPVEE